MKYAKLGKSDLTVSRICMGCMGFGDSSNGQHGWTLDDSASRKIIKYGLKNGINFYDTAIAYQNGTSEQFVGRALRDFGKRDDFVIATKFLPRSQEEIEKNVSGQKHIENSLNQSLKNLGLDYVDLYIYHMWDYHTPMEEIMEGLHEVVKAGKARYVGISNCFAWLLTKVTSPVVGATKRSHVDGGVKAVDLVLSEEEIDCLEELYVPHALAGVMAQNGKQMAGNVV